MRLRVHGGHSPSAPWRAAVKRGVQALGSPALEVVAAEDFDDAVRELTGSTTVVPLANRHLHGVPLVVPLSGRR